MTSLETRIEQAKEKRDAQVRDVVNWHFDPEKGTPFWLKYARQLDFDPRDRIRCYEDLKLLGDFEDAWLRKTPVRDWIPQGFAGRPVSVFETGGSTGVPKSRINIDDYKTDYELFSNTLSDAAFPKGADWLMVGPSGPRRLRLAIEHLAQHRGGICFMVDLDPRWVNKLIKAGKHTEFIGYRDHVVEQALVRLKTHKTIECLFTTPKLLEAICEKIDLADVGIKGIFCGGTEMNAQFHRFAKEELVPTIEFVPTYGNTLMGLACHRPYQNDGDYTITYHPPLPRAVFELVDPDHPERTVEYGETGRVRLTTLTKEFFVPRFLERDEGERARPFELYPWDGVSNLRLFTRFQESVVVGVY